MFSRVFPLAATVLLTACASSHVTTINTGPEIDGDIRSALIDGDLRSVVIVDGESAFWIGGRALPEQVDAFTTALLAAPPSADMQAYPMLQPSEHAPQVLRFDPDTVMAFRQAASVLEFGVWVDDRPHFVRVVRMPTAGAHRYDVRLRAGNESDESLLQRLDGTPALDIAWTNLTSSALAASPEAMSGSPFTVLRAREPLSHGWMRDVGIQFRGPRSD